MKRSFYVLLAAVLLFGAVPLVSSAENGACGCGKDPVLFIDGMNACPLIRDKGTPDERKAFNIDADGIISLVKDNRDAIWDLLDCRYSEETRRTVVDAVCSLFEDTQMTPDGESLYDITPDWRPRTDDIHRSGQNYKICFDWRLDPFENVKILADYIDSIRSITGHDKVDIIAHSLGATLLNTYLSVYGTEKVGGCVWFCGAHNGIILETELMRGRIHINAQDVTAYLHESTPDSFEYQLLSALMQGLADIGVTGSVLSITNRLMDCLREDGSMREILLRSFGRMPSIWACVDDTAYEAAKDYLFPTDDARNENAGLIERIDRYHSEVLMRSAEIMKTAERETGKVAVLSYYGLHVTPVTKDSGETGDQVLDAAHSSCGATFAPFGGRLPKGDRVSPDRTADASTALFPDRTWFVKGCPHSTTPAHIRELFARVFASEGGFTVDDDAQFPQFMSYDKETGSVSPLGKNGLKPAKFAARLRELVLSMKYLIRSLFTKEFWDRA